MHCTSAHCLQLPFAPAKLLALQQPNPCALQPHLQEYDLGALCCCLSHNLFCFGLRQHARLSGHALGGMFGHIHTLDQVQLTRLASGSRLICNWVAATFTRRGMVMGACPTARGDLVRYLCCVYQLATLCVHVLLVCPAWTAAAMKHV